VAYLVKTAILHRQDPQKTIREAVEDVSLSEISRMERRLVVIATVAQIAPLLGLLGTVLGMAEMLIVLQQQGGLIQSADLVRPLMEALMATAAGLTVAIPCYVAFNMLVVKIDRIVLDMERTKSEIVAFLIGPVKEAEPNGK
jgi:biopolymer transport protein ExbB